MLSSEFSSSIDQDVAKAADHCLKPWKHSVINKNDINDRSIKDIILLIKSRDEKGVRHPENDLELEIYKSGEDINLVISWKQNLNQPILWQGKHSFWMDPSSGKRCASPQNSVNIEALARRLRSYFSSIMIQ